MLGKDFFPNSKAKLMVTGDMSSLTLTFFHSLIHSVLQR